MNELLSKTIDTIVKEQLDKNSKNILDALFLNCTDDMNHDEITSRLINNSIRISIDLSVQIVLKLLANSGYIDLTDEDQLRKNLLSVVKD